MEDIANIWRALSIGEEERPSVKEEEEDTENPEEKEETSKKQKICEESPLPLYLHFYGYGQADAIKLPLDVVKQIRAATFTVEQGLHILRKFMQPGYEKIMVTNEGFRKTDDQPLLEYPNRQHLYYTLSHKSDKEQVKKLWEEFSSRFQHLKRICDGFTSGYDIALETFCHYKTNDVPYHVIFIYHDETLDVKSLKNYWMSKPWGPSVPIKYVSKTT